MHLVVSGNLHSVLMKKENKVLENSSGLVGHRKRCQRPPGLTKSHYEKRNSRVFHFSDNLGCRVLSTTVMVSMEKLPTTWPILGTFYTPDTCCLT